MNNSDLYEKGFPHEVKKALDNYVYAYYEPDPDKQVPFYIGRGKDNRVFDHLKDPNKSEKADKINELKKLGKMPVIKILRHSLTQDQAKVVEAVAIDLLGVDNLTNKVKGSGSREFGTTTPEELCRRYNPEEVEIKEKAILITINKAYYPSISPRELYEYTRSSWKLGEVNKKLVEYAFSMYKSTILEVYKIKGWFRGGEIFGGGDENHEREENDRWEFVGKIAPIDIREKYVGKVLAKTQRTQWGAQNPIRYLNIKNADIE